jgi:hypothetical protein
MEVQDQTANPTDLVDLEQQRKLAEGVLNQLGLHPNQAGARNLLDMHFQGPTSDPSASSAVSSLIHGVDQPTAPKMPTQEAIAAPAVTKVTPPPSEPTATIDKPVTSAPSVGQPLVSLGGPSIPSPSAADKITSNLNDRTLQDQSELNRLISTGSGIHQIKNPFLKGLAAVGDVAGATMFPGMERIIPGTYGHHGMLVNTQEGMIKGDLANSEQNARTGQINEAAQNQANESVNKPNELAVWMKQNPGKQISEYWNQKAASMKLTPQQAAMRYYMTPSEEGGGGLTPAEALIQVQKDIAGVKPPNAAQQEQEFQNILAKALGPNPSPKVTSDIKSLFGVIANSPDLTADEKKKAFAHLTSKTSPATQGNLAEIRTGGLLQRGLTPAIDTTTGQLTLITALDNIHNPGKFIPASQGDKSMTRESVFSDIKMNSGMAREAINNLKKPFSTEQRGQLAMALSSSDPAHAWDAFWHSSIADTLTPDQVDYVTSIASIQENAMALRSVQGLGQGSDELRSAIRKMVPSGETPNPQFGNRQLDIFDAIVSRLESGVPKSGVNKPNFPEVPKTKAENQTSVPAVQPPPELLKTTPEGHYVTSPDGKLTWQKVNGQWQEYKTSGAR